MPIYFRMPWLQLAYFSGCTSQSHRLCNTLHLVFTKCSSNIAISSCIQGPLWSDHFAVEMSFNIWKAPLKHQELQYHKIRSIDTKLFGKAIDTHSPS